MSDCGQEMCPNWTGDGRVCACVLLDIEPSEHFPWHYTEFGVVCVCGSPMRDEVCLAAVPTEPTGGKK